MHVREAEVDYYTDAITYTKVRILERFAEEPRRNAPAQPRRGARHARRSWASRRSSSTRTRTWARASCRCPRTRCTRPRTGSPCRARSCAALPFSLEERRDGVVALSYTLGQLAALFLMCDRHDLGVALGDNGQGEARIERGLQRLGHGRGRDEPPPGDDYEPNVFVYDAYPGGIGLSEPLYRLHDRLLAESRALIAACPCHDGCPSCVGPAGEVGSRGKEVALWRSSTRSWSDGRSWPIGRSACAAAPPARRESGGTSRLGRGSCPRVSQGALRRSKPQRLRSRGRHVRARR